MMPVFLRPFLFSSNTCHALHEGAILHLYPMNAYLGPVGPNTIRGEMLLFYNRLKKNEHKVCVHGE